VDKLRNSLWGPNLRLGGVHRRPSGSGGSMREKQSTFSPPYHADYAEKRGPRICLPGPILVRETGRVRRSFAHAVVVFWGGKWPWGGRGVCPTPSWSARRAACGNLSCPGQLKLPQIRTGKIHPSMRDSSKNDGCENLSRCVVAQQVGARTMVESARVKGRL
jgi:hypothetical protein